MEFQGQNILITGGNSGIGKSAAAAFLKAGAKVKIIGRDEKTADAVGELSFFGAVRGLCGDIRRPENCRFGARKRRPKTARRPR